MTINPLLLLVGPIIIVTYVLFREEKRIKAQYGIKDVKVLSSSDPIFSEPRRVTSDVEIEKLVKDYQELIEKRAKKPKNAVENDEH